MNSFIVFSALGSVLALVFAVLMGKRALSADEGTDQMRKIASFIREGANAYLRRQYSVVIAFFGVMFVILCVMAGLGYLTWFVPFAFVTGGFFSGLSGFVGMKIATASNARTANACRTGLNAGLRIAFSAVAEMEILAADQMTCPVLFIEHFRNKILPGHTHHGFVKMGKNYVINSVKAVDQIGAILGGVD